MNERESLHRSPSEIHSDWIDASEALGTVVSNSGLTSHGALPGWTQNLSRNEIEARVDELLEEMDRHFSLAMLASIEGAFNRLVQSIVRTRSKDRVQKAIWKRFEDAVRQEETIQFDSILDAWKAADPPSAKVISRLKELLQFRHWLAHGRHWYVHYWNCPDPNDVLLVYGNLEKTIPLSK